MKKSLKLFGLAVVIAAIALNAMLITGCSDDSGNSGISGISDEPDDSGDPGDLPYDPTTGKYPSINLLANSWGNPDGMHGEQWYNGIVKLSDFSDIEPKQGDILQFKLSGVSDKDLKYFQIELFNHNDDGSESAWLGDSGHTNLPKTFNDFIFEIYIYGSPKPNAPIYLNLVNTLWTKGEDGEYLFNSGETLGGIPNGIVMATIKNLSIKVEKIDEDDYYYGQVFGDYRYREKNGEITITRYEGAGGNVTIPAEINGKPVTTIGEDAFSGCTSLTGITIPNSVTSIGVEAFSGCTSLTSVTIPNSVTSIGVGAFSRCTSLTGITIPNSVTSIGEGAFRNCTSLNEINVDAGNSAYTAENDVLYNKNKTTLVAYPGGKTGAFTIPNSVTSIGDWAFSRCTSLTSVTIPNSVTSIEYAAFSGCTSLTGITIPNSVTSIGQQAFSDCNSLTSVTIGSGVTSIGGSAFSWCTGLTGITIPNSVTSIGDGAFYYCNNLTSVTFLGSNIPDANFGNNAFPEGRGGGNNLKTAYIAGKAGTYTRAANGETWRKS